MNSSVHGRSINGRCSNRAGEKLRLRQLRASPADTLSVSIVRSSKCSMRNRNVRYSRRNSGLYSTSLKSYAWQLKIHLVVEFLNGLARRVAAIECELTDARCCLPCGATWMTPLFIVIPQARRRPTLIKVALCTPWSLGRFLCNAQQAFNQGLAGSTTRQQGLESMARRWITGGSHESCVR